MAWNKIGSGQIKDGAILAQHIGVTEVKGEHIADKAIKEAHLDIDWAAQASKILSTKKVIDYVDAFTAITTSAMANGANVKNFLGGLPLAFDDDSLGVVITGPHSKINLWTVEDNPKLLTDPITGLPVYGRTTDGENLSFYIFKDGEEKPHFIREETKWRMQFPVRFTLDTVSEMFAANEKFVTGGADVSGRMDINQLAADVFGTDYILNKDGLPTLPSGQTIAAALAAAQALAAEQATAIEAVEVTLNGTADDASTGLVSKMTEVEAKIADLENSAGNGAAAQTLHRVNKKADVEVTSYALEADLGIVAEDAPLEATVDVYVNGMLQMVAEHYTETVVDGVVTGLDFNPNVVKVGDVVQLRWMR